MKNLYAFSNEICTKFLYEEGGGEIAPKFEDLDKTVQGLVNSTQAEIKILKDVITGDSYKDVESLSSALVAGKESLSESFTENLEKNFKAAISNLSITDRAQFFKYLAGHEEVGNIINDVELNYLKDLAALPLGEKFELDTNEDVMKGTMSLSAGYLGLDEALAAGNESVETSDEELKKLFDTMKANVLPTLKKNIDDIKNFLADTSNEAHSSYLQIKTLFGKLGSTVDVSAFIQKFNANLVFSDTNVESAADKENLKDAIANTQKFANKFNTLFTLENLKNNPDDTIKQLTDLMVSEAVDKKEKEKSSNEFEEENSLEYLQTKLKFRNIASAAGADDSTIIEYADACMKGRAQLDFETWYAEKFVGTEEGVESNIDKMMRSANGWLRKISKNPWIGKILSNLFGWDEETLGDFGDPKPIENLNNEIANFKENEELLVRNKANLDSWSGSENVSVLQTAINNDQSVCSFLSAKNDDLGNTIGSESISATEFASYQSAVANPNTKKFMDFAKKENSDTSVTKKYKIKTVNSFGKLSNSLENEETELSEVEHGDTKKLVVKFKNSAGDYRVDSSGKTITFALKDGASIEEFTTNIENELKKSDQVYKNKSEKEVKNAEIAAVAVVTPKNEKVDKLNANEKVYESLEGLEVDLLPKFKEFDTNEISWNEDSARKKLVKFVFDNFKGKSLDVDGLFQGLVDEFTDGKKDEEDGLYDIDYNSMEGLEWTTLSRNKEIYEFIKNYTPSKVEKK